MYFLVVLVEYMLFLLFCVYNIFDFLNEQRTQIKDRVSVQMESEIKIVYMISGMHTLCRVQVFASEFDRIEEPA